MKKIQYISYDNNKSYNHLPTFTIHAHIYTPTKTEQKLTKQNKEKT